MTESQESGINERMTDKIWTLEDLERLRQEYEALNTLDPTHEYVTALYKCDHDILDQFLNKHVFNKESA